MCSPRRNFNFAFHTWAGRLTSRDGMNGSRMANGMDRQTVATCMYLHVHDTRNVT
jgi:hypothetical protein